MTILLLFNQLSSSGATGTAFQSFVEAGMNLGNWDIDDWLTFTACTHDDTGAAADADAVPSYAIYENETAAPIVSGNMAQLGAVTGFYTERVQLTAANGFETGKCYAVRVEAVMGGVTAAAAHMFAVKVASANVTLWKDATAPAMTGDAFARLGAPAGASVSADIAEVDASVWSYATRTLTQSSTSTTDSTTAGSIARRRGDSWSISLTVGAITGYTSLWFTAKWDRDNTDAQSVLQIKKNASGIGDGLMYVNGATAADATKASITISDASTGAIIIAVDETVTDDLPPAGIYYDIQVLVSGTVSTPDSGTLTITADVTRSIS